MTQPQASVAHTMRAQARSDRQKWLLLYNCQVMGLGNSLNLLCDDIQVEYHSPGSFHKEALSILDRLETYDRILLAPQMEHEFGNGLKGHENVVYIPTISFNAYHPDICYLHQSGSSLKGALGDYHSLIAYAAFASGLDESRTIALYEESTYEAMGYFGYWDPARQSLLNAFNAHGLDIAQDFLNWSRNGPFMYSFNHPRINCVYDIARAILRRAGLEAAYRDALPHDNLANGPIFPVYPEIGARLGVAGSYLFKLGGEYRFIGLDEFVSESFRLYHDNPEADIRPQFEPVLRRAMTLMKARR